MHARYACASVFALHSFNSFSMLGFFPVPLVMCDALGDETT